MKKSVAHNISSRVFHFVNNFEKLGALFFPYPYGVTQKKVEMEGPTPSKYEVYRIQEVYLLSIDRFYLYHLLGTQKDN